MPQTQNIFGQSMSKYNAMTSGMIQIQMLNQDSYDKIAQKVFEEIRNMGRNDLCFCGSGKKYKNCCCDVNEDSLIASLLYKYYWLDLKVSQMTKDQGIQLLCKKGCSFCCSDYFYISMVEYFAIRRELIQNRLQNQIYTSAEKGYRELAQTAPAEVQKLESDKMDIKKIYDDNSPGIHLTCPLLNEKDGSCLVYRCRPFICRLYGVSYRYNMCERILKKCRKRFGKKMLDSSKMMHHLLDIPYDDYFITDVDVACFKKQSVFFRPYPIVYWLSHDAWYAKFYQQMLQMRKDNFLEFYIKSTK